MDFCTAHLHQLRRTHAVQNAAACIIIGTRRWDHIIMAVQAVAASLAAGSAMQRVQFGSFDV